MPASKDKTGGKPLSALLQILRSNGVTEYETPNLKLKIVLAAGRPSPRAINVSPEALDADPELHGEDDPEDEEGDPRFLLEKLDRKFVQPGHRADPRKNQAS